jgi:hypothetical protein
MFELNKKAAGRQLTIPSQFRSVLHHTGGNAGLLQPMDNGFRPTLGCPPVDETV